MSGLGGDGLNPAQRTAVTTLSGPLLVLAGAGTGKTRVITMRIAELIQDGIQANRILALTFTNKAAREMRERAMKLLGRRKKNQPVPEISTFHSLCVRILRRQATRLGYPENFSIYDRGDQESLARGALRDIRVGTQKLRPGDLVNQVSAWKGAGITPQEAERFCKTDVQILCALAYGKYQASLRASGAMDFDDLLLNTERLFLDHPEARFAEASRFDHLLIDEYQDTNGLQYRIVKAIAERHRNICVVGDDDQSIYGWRGAEVEHILNFKDHWPEARVVRLEENYRCTEWIIHLANKLIAHNKARHDKVLRAARGRGSQPRFLKFDDETQEAESVVREISSKISREDEERVPASDIAILFRTNEQPRSFETELRRAGVPYILIGGQSFFDRKEVKDLLSYLRVIANPLDEVSLLRIINTPARGIGTSSVQTLLDEAVAHGDPLWKLLPAADSHPDLSPSAGAAIEKFRQLIDEFRARVGSTPLSSLMAELIQRIDYRGELERLYKDPNEHEARWGAVEDLINSITTYENRSDSPSLLGFLEESTLSSRDDEKDDDKRTAHSVTLMTLHSAKGLEFPHVYLVGLEEGLLPHKRSVIDPGDAIAEERRLAYVGVTRAKDELTLSFCKNRMKWGKLRAQIPSRFLYEMRGETERAEEVAAAATARLREDHERALAAESEAEAKKNKGKRKKRASVEDGSTEGRKSSATRKRTASPAPPAPSLSSSGEGDFALPSEQTVRDLMNQKANTPRASARTASASRSTTAPAMSSPPPQTTQASASSAERSSSSPRESSTEIPSTTHASPALAEPTPPPAVLTTPVAPSPRAPSTAPAPQVTVVRPVVPTPSPTPASTAPAASSTSEQPPASRQSHEFQQVSLFGERR